LSISIAVYHIAVIDDEAVWKIYAGVGEGEAASHWYVLQCCLYAGSYGLGAIVIEFGEAGYKEDFLIVFVV